MRRFRISRTTPWRLDRDWGTVMWKDSKRQESAADFSALAGAKLQRWPIVLLAGVQAAVRCGTLRANP